MAQATYRIRVLTPVGVAFEETVRAVKLQGIDGELGILPMHARYTGLLGDGLLEYESEEGQTKKVFVRGGFCRFAEDTLTILADALGETATAAAA